MKFKNIYSIGDMSRICNISKKALRFYDKIGLISSYRKDCNNYRYYTKESLLTVPVIKYYKQMGFRLDEMKAFIEGDLPNGLKDIQQSFVAKIRELEILQQEIRIQHVSVSDWHNLIVEAETIIENNIQEVSIKFVNSQQLIFLEQVFESDIKSTIINIDFTNHLESIGNQITGPVFIKFSSFADRVENKKQMYTIMQKALLPCREEEVITFGGCIMISCYHVGPHEELVKTYNKIRAWAKEHDYVLGEELYERYVTDYWTTSNSAKFVTEVMLQGIKKQGENEMLRRAARQSESFHDF